MTARCALRRLSRGRAAGQRAVCRHRGAARDDRDEHVRQAALAHRPGRRVRPCHRPLTHRARRGRAVDRGASRGAARARRPHLLLPARAARAGRDGDHRTPRPTPWHAARRAARRRA
eukprot:6295659-Prymnesium_polylepis.1